MQTRALDGSARRTLETSDGHRSSTRITTRIDRGVRQPTASILAVPGDGEDATEGNARASSEHEQVEGELDLGYVEERFSGTGLRVVMLGDSITAVSRPELHQALSDHAVKIAAVWGEGFGGGPISRAANDEGMRRHARVYAADQPEVAVLALGTNDAWNPDLTLSAALEGLGEMVRAFEGSRLVGVTVTERATADGYDAEVARAINAAVEAAVDEVAEWGRACESDRNTFPDDGIHPTPDGSALLAALVADAVARCTNGRG